MSVPASIPTVITRKQFRAMIDPLLEQLGVDATDIESCSFNSDGFELVVFERDEQGRRIITSRDLCAKQNVFVYIAREAGRP